jgi:hypothetical protein
MECSIAPIDEKGVAGKGWLGHQEPVSEEKECKIQKKMLFHN